MRFHLLIIFSLARVYFTFLPTACHPGARVGFHQLSYTRVILCFSQSAWRKDARVRFHLLIIFSTRRVLFCIFPTACLLGAQVRFHLLCIGSCAFLYFALSPKWLLRRHASETPSTYHLLSYRLVLSILVQSLPRRV